MLWCLCLVAFEGITAIVPLRSKFHVICCFSSIIAINPSAAVYLLFKDNICGPFLPAELLSTAPELLRDPAQYAKGTQKGDVYSFAIVLYEIHGRAGPYGDTHLTPKGQWIKHKSWDLNTSESQNGWPITADNDHWLGIYVQSAIFGIWFIT